MVSTSMIVSNEVTRGGDDSAKNFFLESLTDEEDNILRECIYALQGIDGKRMRFVGTTEKEGSTFSAVARQGRYDGVRVRSEALSDSLLPPESIFSSRLGSGSMDALRICCEAGWLYRRIQSFITKEGTQDATKGSISRALAGAISEEMQSYRNFLLSKSSKPVSLRALLADMSLPTQRLKNIAMITDGLDELSGGPLLSALHMHSNHGDTRHRDLVQRLLAAASRPWFDMLFLWTTQGILSDLANEFFVTEVDHSDDRYLWRERYQIDHKNVPKGLLDPSLIRPAFLIGKGINYIRICLQDADWSMDLDDASKETHERDTSDKSQMNPTGAPIEATLNKAATLVHSYILSSLKDNHCLLQHLFALKQFLLLGQGDFFSALMDGLHAEFGDRTGVIGIYRHTLSGIVESALRSTNANEFPPTILERLQVEMLFDIDDSARHHIFGHEKHSSNNIANERTVWDIFRLEYIVPDPLVAIIHKDAVKGYNAMFSFLFGLKKIEFLLNLTWRQSAVLQHALQTSAQCNGISVLTSPAYAQATVLLRQISMTRQAMMHFVVNLKSFLMFEVLEGGWKNLLREIEDARTLDEIIAAHDAYLASICRKSLLRINKESTGERDLGQELHALLGLVGEFCSYQELLFGDALQAADRAAQKRRKAEQSSTRGSWGFKDEIERSEEETCFGLADETKLNELDRLSKAFNSNVVDYLNALDEKLNGSAVASCGDSITMFASQQVSDTEEQQNDLESLRFLTFQLDHNQYYGLHATSQ